MVLPDSDHECSLLPLLKQIAERLEKVEQENTVVIGGGAESQSDPVPAAEEPKLKTFLISLGDREPVQISAATIEDAIRAYNGDRTNYCRKQLTIVEG